VWWSQDTLAALAATHARLATYWDLAAVHRLLFGGWRAEPGLLEEPNLHWDRDEQGRRGRRAGDGIVKFNRLLLDGARERAAVGTGLTSPVGWSVSRPAS
jgi:hypothetical protein